MQSTNDQAAARGPGRLRVMVLGPADHQRVQHHAAAIRSAISEQADIVLWDLGFEHDIDGTDADLAVVLGGDGSILRAALQMGYRQTPVVGVNLGKLGFLADLSVEQFFAALPDLCRGRYRTVPHLMFECRLFRTDASGASMLAEQRLGLNEVAVLAGPPFKMLDVQLYVDAELATTYSADGLIVSTPVGSTAHSLSAGGPILRKDLQAFVISPISPHTLTNRPVVDAATRVYELVVPRPHAGTSLVVDGRMVATLAPGDRVRIERAEPCFQLVSVSGHTYYRTLRDKLGWGGSLPGGESR